MRAERTCLVLACLVLAGTASGLAQGNPFDSPQLRHLIQQFWNPVVGSGEVYQTAGKSNPDHTMQIAVVGKETVEGKQAYWLELAINSPELGGMAYGKDLIVPGEATPRRVIMQIPGEPAMELPRNDRPGAMKVKDTHLHKVGTETITVPAGTFACEHWKDDNGDAWLNSKVSPITLVKSVNKKDPSDTDVLVKVITAAKDHITGPIKPFDPSVFMRHMKGPGGR